MGVRFGASVKTDYLPSTSPPPSSMIQGQIKGLNSLRFFAAILVLVGHARLDLTKLSIPQPDWRCLRFGSSAVEFFFVLSGFLLTHLALREWTRTGRFQIKGFYLRRVLRIWPLYYLCMAFGTLLIVRLGPAVHPGADWPNIGGLVPYFACMLPNYAIALQPTNVGALYALWSIGVEEQFYVFFPFLMLALLGRAHACRYILLLAVIYTALYLLVFPVVGDGTLLRFLHTLKFHFMLYGSAGAFFWHHRQEWLDRFLPDLPATGWILAAIAMIHVFAGPFAEESVQTLLSGILYTAIILHFRNGRAAGLFNNAILDQLGVISYGIYMYHPYVSYLLRFGAQRSTTLQHLFMELPLSYYLFLAGMTVLVAQASFTLFERRFLRWKTHVPATTGTVP